jgi:hypothetical protein
MVAWCVVLFVAWTPTLLTTGSSDSVAIRLGATMLLTQVGTFILVQLFGPRAVVESRMISNTFYSLVILTICAAVTIALPLVPTQSLSGMKMGAMLGFNPIFLAVNVLVCLVIGLIIYRIRALPLFDYVELYWNLGLVLLAGIGIGLIHLLAH